jgi:hypothetical protein
MQSLRHVVSFYMKECRVTHPNWTVVQALAHMLSDSNTKLTAPMVLEYAEHIISEWIRFDFEPNVFEEKLTPIEPLDSFKNGFSDKYGKNLKTLALLSVDRCREAHPDLSLVEIVANIIKTTHADMPIAFLREFVQHIVAAWEMAEIAKKESSELAIA